ncbi:MAG: methylene-tetrahydromethanopterin dehydrogenase N-terminal domain-containing protein [Thermoproteota archaeon]
MPKKGYKTVFIFLDTDKHASPFDMLTTIDVLSDVDILKYENVTVEDVDNMVQDMMFPRGPKGVKHTKIFLNGRDLNRINDILQKIKESMFPPFELSVVVDPRGAYTTATAAVAKTLKLSLQKDLGNLKEKKVTVLAGTGPVGQTAARLYASEGAEVIVTSRSINRASAVAEKVNEELGEQRVKGAEAKTDEGVGKAIESAEIILSAGAAGIQLLPLETLKKYGKNCKIVADINAVPPLGVEGLNPDSDGEDVTDQVMGIGALAIGKLKNCVEAQLIQRAAEEPKGIFDYEIAYEIGKDTIRQELE